MYTKFNLFHCGLVGTLWNFNTDSNSKIKKVEKQSKTLKEKWKKLQTKRNITMLFRHTEKETNK